MHTVSSRLLRHLSPCVTVRAKVMFSVLITMPKRSMKQNVSDLQAPCPRMDSSWNAEDYCLWEITGNIFTPLNKFFDYLHIIRLITRGQKICQNVPLSLIGCRQKVYKQKKNSRIYAYSWLDLMGNEVNYGFAFLSSHKMWLWDIFWETRDEPAQRVHLLGQYLIYTCLKFDFKLW